MGARESSGNSSSKGQTCCRWYSACAWLISSKDYLLILVLFLLVLGNSFALELPENFKLFEQDDLCYLMVYDTPIAIAKDKEELTSILMENYRIVEFWMRAPSVLLKFEGPEDLKKNVIDSLKELGVVLGNGHELFVKLKRLDNFILMEVSYDSRKLSNRSSLSSESDWKKDLKKHLKELLNLPEKVEIPHVLFVKTFGNTVRYNGSITSEDFSIVSDQEEITIEIFKNHGWEKLLYKIHTPAEILELNYFDVDFRTIPENAELLIDDVYLGKTPVTVNLRGGIHSLEIKFPGYKTIRENIYIDNTETFEYRLEKLQEGTLILNMNVSHATITIDEKIYKTTSGSLILNVSPGIHNVLVEAENRERFEQNIQLKPSETKELTINLRGVAGTKDWELLVDTEKIVNFFITSFNEIVLHLKDDSLICINPSKSELLWTLKDFKNVVDIQKHNNGFLVLCKDSLWLVDNQENFPILQLKDESFISWDFDELFFATNSGKLYKLSEKNFSVLWVRKIYPLLQIKTTDDFVLMLDVFRNVYCYNIRTMQLIWKKYVSEVTALDLIGKNLYIASGEKLRILDIFSGKELENMVFSNRIDELSEFGKKIILFFKNSIEDLNGNFKIKYSSEKVFFDKDNIYLVGSKRLKIYFLKEDDLYSKTIDFFDSILSVKISRNGSIILLLSSGRLVKIFGFNGY
jgi:hypothetical protein